jgi:hypothetical protein
MEIVRAYLHFTTGSAAIPTSFTPLQQLILYNDHLVGSSFINELRQWKSKAERRRNDETTDESETEDDHRRPDSVPTPSQPTAFVAPTVPIVQPRPTYPSYVIPGVRRVVAPLPDHGDPSSSSNSSHDRKKRKARKSKRDRPKTPDEVLRADRKKERKNEKKSAKLYKLLLAGTSQQKMQPLRHVSDQIKRSAEWRKWINTLNFVFMQDSNTRQIIDSRTLRINSTANIPGYALEAASNVIRAQVNENMQHHLRQVDELDAVSLLLTLENYCTPSDPSVRSLMQSDIRYLRMLPTENGTQLMSRYQRMVDDAAHYNIFLEESELIDILLEALYSGSEQQTRVYGALIMQLRLQRSAEESKQRGEFDPLTLLSVGRAVDAIDHHTSAQKSRRTNTKFQQQPSQRTPASSQFRRGRTNTANQVTPQANQVQVAAGKPFKMQCWACGGNHHLKDHPGMTEEEKSAIYEKRYHDKKPNKSDDSKKSSNTHRGNTPSTTVRTVLKKSSHKGKDKNATSAHVNWCQNNSSPDSGETANWVIESSVRDTENESSDEHMSVEMFEEDNPLLIEVFKEYLTEPHPRRIEVGRLFDDIIKFTKTTGKSVPLEDVPYWMDDDSQDWSHSDQTMDSSRISRQYESFQDVFITAEEKEPQVAVTQEDDSSGLFSDTTSDKIDKEDIPSDDSFLPSYNMSDDDSYQANMVLNKCKVKHAFIGIPPVHEHEGLGQDWQNYWLPDSGTSANMTPYISDLDPSSIEEYDSRVTVANKRQSIVTHRGNVRLRLRHYLTDEEIIWELSNVLVCPDLGRRLISTDVLNSHQHDVKFTQETVDFHLRMEDLSGSYGDVFAHTVVKIPKRYNYRKDTNSLHWPFDALRSASQVGKGPKSFLVSPAIPTHMSSHDDLQPFYAHSSIEENNNESSSAAYPHTTCTMMTSLDDDAPASPATSKEYVDFKPIPGKRQVGSNLLHQRLGHRSMPALMLGHKDDIWSDVCIKHEPEPICATCKISFARKTNRSKQPPSNATTIPGRSVVADLQYNPFPVGLTKATHFTYYMLIVDVASTYTVLMGLNKINSKEVIRLLNIYRTLFRPDMNSDDPVTANLHQLTQFHSDAGSQFNSPKFLNDCIAIKGIAVTLAAPKHQEMNGLCERTWQSVRNLAFSFMNHARVGEQFGDMALEHAWKVFNVLPIKGLIKDDLATTPYAMFFNRKPPIRKFRTLFCPCFYKTYDRTRKDLKTDAVRTFNTKNHPQRGLPGIFVGIPRGQAGFLVYNTAQNP